MKEISFIKKISIHSTSNGFAGGCALLCVVSLSLLHVVYRNCFWHSEQFLYTTCSSHVLQKEELLTKIYLYQHFIMYDVCCIHILCWWLLLVKYLVGSDCSIWIILLRFVFTKSLVDIPRITLSSLSDTDLDEKVIMSFTWYFGSNKNFNRNDGIAITKPWVPFSR